MSTLKAFNTPKGPPAFGPFSHAKMNDSLLFTTGQLGIDPATGNIVPGGVEAETRQVFRNLTAILEEAGLGLDSILKATIYLTDMKDFEKVNEIYAGYFTGDYPARSCIGVSSLAKGGVVEIEVICSR
ncbi:RidA family protein [Marispirochaeta aestuarii]|uniref:RidA family protein n=1 Tax=Marispirochaeta aestuarii TaxID=1963862 RepID=UPI0029C79E07|nr:RidA family protein [Marispirochaeta aestuarii]